MEYEKDGYTWIQGETLAELSRPERVRQIKLDYIKKQENLKAKTVSGLLVDMFDDDDEMPCAKFFVWVDIEHFLRKIQIIINMN